MKALIGLFALALVLSACGSDSSADDTVATVTTVTITEQETDSTTTPAEEEDMSETDGETATDGDNVAVHYRGTLDDGTEFDSSEGRDPLSFVVGSGQVIAGFDDAVRGLSVGDSRTVRIEPEDAYGEYTEEEVEPDLRSHV